MSSQSGHLTQPGRFAQPESHDFAFTLPFPIVKNMFHNGNDLGVVLNQREQKAIYQLRMEMALSRFSNGSMTGSRRNYAKFFRVNLNHTTITPGTLFSSKAGTIRGWFNAGTTVKMWFGTQPAGSSIAVEDLIIQSVAPETTPLRASSTSSITKDLGFGFFGFSGTTSVRESITNSFTYSIEGFEVANDSNDIEVNQRYVLSALQGAKYTGPESLWHGAALYEPPLRATNDMVIPSQALWLASADTNGGLVPDPISVTVPFNVEVSVDWVWAMSSIFDDNAKLVVSSQHTSHTVSKTWQFDVDFSMV